MRSDRSMPDTADTQPLKTTPLDALHRELGGRMVPFAGYAMPVQYKAGILAEHLATRAQATLFDVSHMGQALLTGDGADAALERLVPGDIVALKPGRIRYTMLTTPSAGILDDIMVTRLEHGLGLVLNAANKDADLDHLRAHLPAGVELHDGADRALLALQGPAAALVLARHVPGIDALPFMATRAARLAGATVSIARSGYTGEDGYELSLPATHAEALARLLLAEPEVSPAGLGARDSLRLEAGLCLHGHDIDASTTPIEAGLGWTFSKRRRAEGGYPGDMVVRVQLERGPERLRVGIQPDGRAPAREGTVILDEAGAAVGTITSGGFGPSADRPVAMGYVPARLAAPGTPLTLMVRGKPLPARIIDLPFVPHRYFRG